MKQNGYTNQVIRNDESEDTKVYTSSSVIQEYDVNHQLVVPILGQMRWKKILHNARVVLPNKRSCDNSLIACLPLPISLNPSGAMALPLV